MRLISLSNRVILTANSNKQKRESVLTPPLDSTNPVPPPLLALPKVPINGKNPDNKLFPTFEKWLGLTGKEPEIPEIKELEKILEIKEGTLGEIRPANQLTEADIIKLIDRQINQFSITEINNLINTFPAKDKEEAKLILLSLCQNGNLDRLKQFGSNFRNDYASGDLLSTLRYLENKELLNDNFYNTGNYYLLDNALLHKLQTDADFRNSVIEEERTLYYPSGWLNGINPFNQANFPTMKDSIQEVMGISKKLRKQDKYMDLIESVSEATDQKLKETLKQIDPRLIDLLFVQQDTSIFESNKLSEERILERLSTSTITESTLQNTLDSIGLPERYKQIALEVLAHGVDMYSFRRMGEALKSTHVKIQKLAKEKSIKEEDIYYFVPLLDDPYKSFQLINLIFSSTNKIPSEKIIRGKEIDKIQDSGNKMVVILDDIAMSGESLAFGVTRLRQYHKFSGKIVVAPLTSSKQAEQGFSVENTDNSNFWNPFLGIPSDPKFTYLPAQVLKSFRESAYYQLLPKKIKEEFNLLMGGLGVGSNAANVIFPYMSPDNNNAFFSSNIATLVLPKAAIKGKIDRKLQHWSPQEEANNL